MRDAAGFCVDVDVCVDVCADVDVCVDVDVCACIVDDGAVGLAIVTFSIDSIDTTVHINLKSPPSSFLVQGGDDPRIVCACGTAGGDVMLLQRVTVKDGGDGGDEGDGECDAGDGEYDGVCS